MAVNKIKISANTRKVLNKTKEILGIQGENMKDVLFFALSEKIDGTAVVEIELPNGVQSFVELIKVEDGYELPVKSVLTEQAGFVKFQLRILQNKVEVFKSEIFELEVKESLNAIYEEPEEYPTWLDKLEDLQTELNNSEKERISNENERIESEEARKENFTQMQKSVKGAISNIKDLTENYNLNATEKTNKFDENYTEKKKAFDDNYSETLKSFNDNAETKYDNYNKNAENKTSEYNKNNDEKLKAYNDNHTTKITNFDTNAKNKTDEYNSNASKKLDDYNSNDTTKTEKYNENATTKLSDYNSNATAKKKEYDTNAENKIVEFNNNATEKLDEYNQNAESLTNRVIECESENERLRNDIKSIALTGDASGENIHLEDSSNARCEIEIGGNHQQDTREGYNLLNNNSQNFPILEGVNTDFKEDGSFSIKGTPTGTWSRKRNTGNIYNIEAGTYTVYFKVVGNCPNARFTIVLEDADMKTIASVAIGVSNSSLIKVATFNYDGTTEIVYTSIVLESFKTDSSYDCTFYPMLMKGTYTADVTYEQYGASPSIDYPSEVKTVGSNVNLLTYPYPDTTKTVSGITFTDVGDGTVIANGTATGAVYFNLGRPTLNKGEYYLSGIPFGGSGETYEIKFGTHNYYSGGTFEVTESSFIPAESYIKINKGNTVNDLVFKPKLEKCSVATPYSPYNCGSAKVDIVNENIFNTENVKSTSEVSVVDNKNGVLELQGVSGFWKGITTTQKFETGKRVYIKCKVIEGTGSSGNIGIKDNNGDNILENYKVSNNLISCSFISKGITKIFFRCNGASNNGNIKYSDIMFSYEDIDYMPHQEQSYLVDVQQPMFEGDKFVKQDKKWYEQHCVKTEIMLTFPTTNIEVCGTFANFQTNRNIAFAVVKNDLKITNVRNDILCDKLKARDNSMWGGKEDGIQTYINSNKFMISIPFEDIEKNFGEESIDQQQKKNFGYVLNMLRMA